MRLRDLGVQDVVDELRGGVRRGAPDEGLRELRELFELRGHRDRVILVRFFRFFRFGGFGGFVLRFGFGGFHFRVSFLLLRETNRLGRGQVVRRGDELSLRVLQLSLHLQLELAPLVERARFLRSLFSVFLRLRDRGGGPRGRGLRVNALALGDGGGGGGGGGGFLRVLAFDLAHRVQSGRRARARLEPQPRLFVHGLDASQRAAGVGFLAARGLNHLDELALRVRVPVIEVLDGDGLVPLEHLDRVALDVVDDEERRLRLRDRVRDVAREHSLDRVDRPGEDVIAVARVRRARGRDRRRRDVRGAIFLSLLVLLLLRSRARRSRRRAVSARDRLRERARDAIARSVRRDLAAVRGGDGGHRRRRVRRRRARAR
mmetsp:Transcript_4327/g.15245  ORF Transcript_4327/g.15245 Transcript_4327/m.15245 type:complete len:374 (-) Transcript_4327:8-1129(-)